MPNYRRATTPGATWFFTVNLLQRQANDLLVRDMATAGRRRGFPTRWRRIKTDFSLGLPKTERRSHVRLARGERGIWQRRYWEHQIRNDRSLQRHMDYIHFNPVKHGWATRPVDWPHSSFAHHVARGTYEPEWRKHPPCHQQAKIRRGLVGRNRRRRTTSSLVESPP